VDKLLAVLMIIRIAFVMMKAIRMIIKTAKSLSTYVDPVLHPKMSVQRP